VSSESPLTGLRFSIAGPGKVGTSLAAWSVAKSAHLETEAGRGALRTLETAGQDFLLLAVPEAQMATAAAELSEHRQASFVFHTAGSLGSDALAPLSANGSRCGVLHPLKAFATALPEPSEGHGVTFGWSGDPATLPLARRLVSAWGGILVEIPDELRPVYHLAATFAAGGVVTLLSAACELATRLGLPPEVAAGYFTLARGSLEAAAKQEAAAPGRAAAALTGPIARGYARGIERSLEELSRWAPEKQPLAVAVAFEGVRQLRRLHPEWPASAELESTLRKALAGALQVVLSDPDRSDQNTDSE
jgi:predicted short-subunit dehydrogenase-like oxidoreductase (DUF2520 family)